MGNPQESRPTGIEIKIILEALLRKYRNVFWKTGDPIVPLNFEGAFEANPQEAD